MSFSKKFWGVVWIAGIGVALGMVVSSRRTNSLNQERVRGEPPAETTRLEETTVEIPLYFPRADLSGLEKKVRRMPDRRDSLAGWVGMLVEGLAHAPSTLEVAVFPAGSELRHVFADDQGGVFLDFASSLRGHAQIGVQLESLSLKALLQTLQENLPGYRSVQLLVEGKEQEALWGHVYTRKPFALNRFE